MSRTKVQLVGDVNGGANFSGIVTATGGIKGIGISSAGTNIHSGIITALNFIGLGNTFAVNGSVVDISIAGGGGASYWVQTDVGIHTLSSVGVGTTNPSAKLEVSGDILITGGGNIISKETSSTWSIAGGNTYQNGGAIGLGGSSSLIYPGAITFFTGSSSTNSERARITNTGNFGIGLTNPSTTLEVNGTATVTTLVETSSITLKENINPIVNALDKVVQLNPVTYDRKSGKSKNEAGLIAEEVNDIIPNIVSKDDEGNPNGINYTKLSVYLIDAIKELKKQIDELKG